MARLLDEARHDDIVVQLADGTAFLLVAIDDLNQELAKSRKNPRLMALLDARASQAATTSLDDVKRQLNL